jgi:hypothetical protein
LTNQFSTGFDLYLDILHAVDVRAKTALGRIGVDWRLKNACAPCMYKLQDEPELTFSMQVTVDGNSSLKLVDEKI